MPGCLIRCIVAIMPDEQYKLGEALDSYKEGARVTAAEIAARTTVASIPYAGGPILELWNGLAQRRTQERVNTVFENMRERLEFMDADKVNRAFFDSEEFQTLLYLLLEKLHTTHDERKLKMFGDALANSGRTEFQTSDKESYVRTLRDLSLGDLRTLEDKNLKNWLPLMKAFVYGDDVLSSLSRLAALGLVSNASFR